MLKSLTSVALLAALALAHPLPRHHEGDDVCTSTILEVAPDTETCPANLDQCSTAAIAGPLITASFEKYGITEPYARGAILANIMYESAILTYNRKQDGTPGSGTANMQSAYYNALYAQTFPELACDVEALAIDTSSWEAAEASDPEALDELLDILTEDEYNFGSAAWFFSEYCKDIEPLFASDVTQMEAFTAYVECFGGSRIEDRFKYYMDIAPTYDRNRAIAIAKIAEAAVGDDVECEDEE